MPPRPLALREECTPRHVSCLYQKNKKEKWLDLRHLLSGWQHYCKLVTLGHSL